MKRFVTLVIAAASLLVAPAALAEVPEYEITIKEHKFEPSTLTIPADTRVKLVVKNADATPEEFESHDFNREKIIPGGKETAIYVGPLDKGEYAFFGEFNPETAQGKLIVE